MTLVMSPDLKWDMEGTIQYALESDFVLISIFKSTLFFS
jgi:hypothetical protein